MLVLKKRNIPDDMIQIHVKIGFLLPFVIWYLLPVPKTKREKEG